MGIPGADFLQFGALGVLGLFIVVGAIMISRLSPALHDLAVSLLQFSVSNQVLASKLDSLGSKVSHAEDSVGATRAIAQKLEQRQEIILAKVCEVERHTQACEFLHKANEIKT